MAGTNRFAGRTVLITGADIYMGPAIGERFEMEGARVIRDTGRYADADDPARIVAAAGAVDVLVINLTPVDLVWSPILEVTEQNWQDMFDLLVHPTMRFIKAALPQMIERREGKIIVVTSAAPLRAVADLSAYTAARGAQNALVLAVGAEVAREPRVGTVSGVQRLGTRARHTGD